MGGTEPLLLGCAGSSIEWRTKNGNGPGYGIRIVDVLLAYRLKPGGPGSGDAGPGEGGAESQSVLNLERARWQGQSVGGSRHLPG